MKNYLLERAGLAQEIVDRGQTDQDFNEILDALREIHKGKQVLYGNYLTTHGSDPLKFCLMEHYCDIKRKFVRAENFLKKVMDGQDIPMPELLDTYSDIAVYGALGVQLLFHLMEREK
jgi:hypothetical protein